MIVFVSIITPEGLLESPEAEEGFMSDFPLLDARALLDFKSENISRYESYRPERMSCPSFVIRGFIVKRLLQI